MFQFKYIVFLLLFVLSGLGACSSSGTSSSSDDDAVEVNALAAAFPDGMAVASPFASGSDADASINRLLGVVKFQEEDEDSLPNPADMTYAEKQALISSILNATSLADCFAYEVDIFEEADTAECYGPEVTLTGNHPDGAIGGGSQALPTGDLGIWTADEDDEACLSAKMNEEFVGVTGKIDFAMLTMATSFCVANNSGLELPAEGESLDLTDEVVDAYDSEESESAFDPETVVLSRLDDTDEGNAVYNLDVTGVMVNNDESTNPVTLNVTHVPGDEDNTTYNGLVQMTIVTDNIPATNCGGGDHTVGMSTLYQLVAEDDLRVNFRQGVFCGEAEDDVVFDDNGLADKTNPKMSGCPGGDAGDTDGWGDDFNELIANVDPSTGLGNLTYAWQAGRCDGNTRVFQATLSETGGEDSNEGGCGYFGFGDDIAEDALPEIQGMICNWAGPGAEAFGSKTVQPLVQRQCVTRGADEDVFSSIDDQLAIAYAPTINCNQATGLVCDGVACEVTHSLLDFEDMSFTAPELPDNI